MGRKSKFTKEVKLQAVNYYLDGNKSTESFSEFAMSFILLFS